MRLHRLHIAGFKSFSDRAELAFDHGVTAIVGPNGCGKSNVADAIVWVLGEQSARSLRGERMEDVIFNGSDARKPQSTAEVTLRLSGVTPGAARPPAGLPEPPDGDDGIERPLLGLGGARDVELTRRLYRSGESEYLINGELCRLRDIHDLLMDTGLGAKAYAIIEQGKIGQILSTRPADRRQIIEEAAGVTKYKARRHAAELKLEASQQNLTRIDDIVFEVERQRNALVRQAAKARRYKRLRDQLRRWEKVLAARRYAALEAEILASRARLEQRRADEAARAGRLAALELDLTRTRIELSEAESAVTASREAVHAGELEIDRVQTQEALNRQQHEALGARAVEIAAERESLLARREPARLALDEARLALERSDTERDRAMTALSAAADGHLAAQRDLTTLEARVEAARGSVYTAMSTVTALRHAVESAGVARDRVTDGIARLEAEQEDLRVEQERAAGALAAARAELRRAHGEIESTRAARRAGESDLASARIEHEWRARDVRAREHEMAAITARLKSLEELDAARAGYADAARLVLAETGGPVRHAGSVADYLEVSESHDRAVEALLGDLLQHVVVADHGQAVLALDLIRSRQAGRCGFLVTGPEPADVPEPARTGPPIEGLEPLTAAVRVTGPYRATIRLAIGDAWIAPTLDAAIEAAPQTTAPIVTLAGEVVRGRHQVTGGGRAESKGILATKREIKHLRDRAAAGQVDLERLAADVASLESAIAAANTSVAGLVTDEHRQEKTLVGIEAQLQRAADDVDRLSARMELVSSERQRAEDERRAIESRQQEARHAIGITEEERRIADEQLAGAQQRLAEARDEVAVLERIASDARATSAVLVERAAAAGLEVARLEEAAAELETRLAARRAELDQIEERRGALDVALEAGERQLDGLFGSLDVLKREVLTGEERLARLREAADGQESGIRDARKAVDEVRQQVAEIDIALARFESDLAHLAATTVETLQCTLDEVMDEVRALEVAGALPAVAPLAGPEDADEEDSAASQAAGDGEADVPPADGGRRPAPSTPEEAIADLKQKIDRLGPVNMMAIEQFDELDQRLTFMTAQRRDLVESIAATGEAIRRIDETSRSRFREAFEAITLNFQESFRTLFGGGQAGLTLLDEQDVLESGIEIVAQPPGKRLQNVQLLSGGEKALAAIALMFAIFRYKPSPFCVLDEIDAPLDDANIGRFVDVLRQMQDETQFILITHNRKTMEIADRLYGVTMEEPGVSKLISVRLN